MGAPKGNKNNLKHGLYSRFIAVADDLELIDMSDSSPLEELAVARVCLKDCLERRQAATDEKIHLGYDAAVRHYLKIIFDAKTAIVQNPITEANIWVCWLDALRSANDRQKVQR